MNRTKIEWCDASWNPVVGCTHGCPWCYARRQAKRMKHKCGRCYRFQPHLHPERLDEPARVRKHRTIFVCSMGELFGPATADTEPGYHVQGPMWRRVMTAMLEAPWHRYIILTKRPDIAYKRLRSLPVAIDDGWWFLTSVANQADADERIPQLLRLGELGIRNLGVSAEPLLGPIDLIPWFAHDYDGGGGAVELWAGLRWVIVGAQTGPGAKPVDQRHVAGIVDQCFAADVPCFVKNNVGGVLSHVRGYPKGR
jgi:protein gp37